MPGFIKTPEDERLWQKAKDRAEEQGHKEDWPYVTGIWKKMKGEKTAGDSNPATDVFLGISPTDDPWHGGAPRFGVDFSSPKAQILRQQPTPSGAVSITARWVFGDGRFGNGVYAESQLFGRFARKYPGSINSLTTVFAREIEKREAEFEASIRKWFKEQPGKPLFHVVDDSRDWGKPVLVDIREVTITDPSSAGGGITGRLGWGVLKMRFEVVATLQATKLPDVTVGPFSQMSDTELNEWIGVLEHEGPENFWMDGELHMSRPQAYAMYRKQWRAMRPREQRNMLDGLQQHRYGGTMNSTQRVAARYLQKKADDDRETLCRLLALLRAVQWQHLACHWKAAGPDGYEDHLLFERLYGGIAGEVDGLAEKIVATLGGSHVDAVPQSQLMTHFLERWVAQGGLIQQALAAEQDLQTAVEEVLDEVDLSVGLENFLQGVADAHETAIYLLTQRLRAE